MNKVGIVIILHNKSLEEGGSEICSEAQLHHSIFKPKPLT